MQTETQSTKLFNLMESIDRKVDTLMRLEKFIYDLKKDLLELSDDVFTMHKEEYERENPCVDKSK